MIHLHCSSWRSSESDAMTNGMCLVCTNSPKSPVKIFVTKAKYSRDVDDMQDNATEQGLLYAENTA